MILKERHLSYAENTASVRAPTTDGRRTTEIGDAKRLKALGQSNSIPFQCNALGRAAPNDSNSIQVTRAGVAAGDRVRTDCNRTIASGMGASVIIIQISTDGD